MEKFSANKIPITVGTVNLSLFKTLFFEHIQTRTKKLKLRFGHRWTSRWKPRANCHRWTSRWKPRADCHRWTSRWKPRADCHRWTNDFCHENQLFPHGRARTAPERR